MRNDLLILMVFLYSCLLWSQQEVIVSQSFEPSGDTWGPYSLSTPACSANDDHWNTMSSLSSILPNQGNHFWGIQDLNGNCGSADFEWIELPEIDVSVYREVQCSFDLQVIGFDSGDDVAHEIWFDGIAQERVTIIDGFSNLSTEGWIRISIDIPNSVSSVKLRIYVKQNGTDQAGIDNITLSGIPFIACSELMLSEYVEGGSSNQYRNNYLEIFNPTDSAIDLNNYELVKYTGKNSEVSSVLRLEGSIDALSTFLIEDDQEQLEIDADLSTNNAVMNFTGDDKIGLRHHGLIIDLIGKVGDSLDFAKDLVFRRKSSIQGPNTVFDPDEWDTYGFEVTNNLGKHQSICQGPQPEIQLFGNGLEIQDQDLKSQIVDNTYFGIVEAGSNALVMHDFIIINNGNAPLIIDDILISGSQASDFFIPAGGNHTLLANDSLVVRVNFQPRSKGVHNGLMTIYSNDASENPYTFLIQGEGSGYTNGPLMISTYYEGEANNRWIELCNISSSRVEANTYYLGLYRQDLLQSPLSNKPSSKKAIPALDPGQTLKFRASLNVNKPAYALDGNEIASGVCNFNGDDVVIISSTDDEGSWENRIDIIGSAELWGTDVAYVRKYGCHQELPHSGFDTNRWIPFETSEIDQAGPGKNNRLGEYYFGLTSFENSVWSNGLPDLNRIARIIDEYQTQNHGNLEACNLSIAEQGKLVIGGDNFTAVSNDLEVLGNLEVRQGGDLLMINNSGKITGTGSIRIQKLSAPVSPFDYTYWSSPLESAELQSVFRGSDPDYMFTFSTSQYEDLNQDNVDDDRNAWVRASGNMLVGKGYAVMAPTTLPSGERQEILYEGVPNNGIIEKEIKLRGAQNSIDDWNLIGNPYPSSLDAELLIKDARNSGLLGGTLYFWTHNSPLHYDPQSGEQQYATDDYAMYTIGMGGIRAQSGGFTPSNHISSCQGFFVEALSSGSLYFDNTMRASVPGEVFFKDKDKKESIDYYSDQKGRIWLNLQNSQGAFSQILIGFDKGATSSFDNNFDGVRLSANTQLDFYSPLDSLKLAIRGEPLPQVKKIIPLGYDLKSEEISELEIVIDKTSGGLENNSIILWDTYLNIKYDLKEQAYRFQPLKVGQVKDRFVLLFDEPFIPDDDNENTYSNQDEENKIIWHFEDSDLLVRSLHNNRIRSFRMYDLLGRSIATKMTKETTVRYPAHSLTANTCYLIFLELDNKQILTTKILAIRP